MMTSLQLTTSQKEFDLLGNIFLEELPEPDYGAFKQYFQPLYLAGPLSCWYEGHNDFVMTNNGLEATNNVIKDEHTGRTMHSLTSFLAIALNIIQSWTTHDDDFAETPQIGPALYREAYQIYLHIDEFEKVSDKQWLLVKPGFNVDESVITARWTGNWTSFAIFEAALDNVFLLTSNDAECSVSCTCRDGAKKKPCQHSVALAHHLHYLSIPIMFRSRPLVTRGTSRGRPPRTGSALQMERDPPAEVEQEPATELTTSEPAAPEQPARRGPGRRPKQQQQPQQQQIQPAPQQPARRGPGRPPKQQQPARRGPGRPPKTGSR